MFHTADPFLLELLVIFLWAKIFGILFERIKLPAVLGEILAGVLLGPYATGLITASGSVNSIAELGAIFLLFTVGLETVPQELIRTGRVALGVACAGIVLPFGLGFGYMLRLDRSVHEATFVAAAMVATSVGITARILSDLGVLQSRASRIILGAAVFDDILGMILLALVIGLVSAGGVKWWSLGLLTGEAVGFALIMMFYAPRLIQHMRPGLQNIPTPNAPLIMALATCLALSVTAEKIGMAGIIGAFFAGLAFSEYSPEWNLGPRINAINEFLAPYFFFTMGAQLNVKVINGPLLRSAAIISALAIFSKLVGCGLPVLREGWRTALRVGAGMTPRGEVGLIVALVGLQMNMISQPAYALVLFMTASTTLLAPLLLRMVFREELGDSISADPEREDSALEIR